jgi:hypothetical protein
VIRELRCVLCDLRFEISNVNFPAGRLAAVRAVFHQPGEENGLGLRARISPRDLPQTAARFWAIMIASGNLRRAPGDSIAGAGRTGAADCRILSNPGFTLRENQKDRNYSLSA